MLKYAREDTHYLLYIYDILCEKLSEKAKCSRNIKSTDNLHFVKIVLRKSAEVASIVYEKPLRKCTDYYFALSRYNRILSPVSMSVYKWIFKFR